MVNCAYLQGVGLGFGSGKRCLFFIVYPFDFFNLSLCTFIIFIIENQIQGLSLKNATKGWLGSLVFKLIFYQQNPCHISLRRSLVNVGQRRNWSLSCQASPPPAPSLCISKGSIEHSLEITGLNDFFNTPSPQFQASLLFSDEAGASQPWGTAYCYFFSFFLLFYFLF